MKFQTVPSTWNAEVLANRLCGKALNNIRILTIYTAPLQGLRHEQISIFSVKYCKLSCTFGPPRGTLTEHLLF